jgi:hypothetical protein
MKLPLRDRNHHVGVMRVPCFSYRLARLFRLALIPQQVARLTGEIATQLL